MCINIHREEGLKEVQDKVKSYDWTFTTAYKGSMRNSTGAEIRVSGVMPRLHICILRYNDSAMGVRCEFKTLSVCKLGINCA